MCFEKPEGFWPGKTIKNKRAMKNEICFCRFCKKECKNKLSLMNHERVCRLNPSRQRIEDYAWSHKKNRLTILILRQLHKVDCLQNTKSITSKTVG